MSKGKIYISGPVTGTADYKERFTRKQNELEMEGWTVYNPVTVTESLPSDTTHEEYMRITLALLSLCDTIYLMEGWESSKGARMEWAWASFHELNKIEE